MGNWDDEDKRRKELQDKTAEAFIKYQKMIEEQTEQFKNSPLNNMNPEIRHSLTMDLTMMEIFQISAFCVQNGIATHLFPIQNSNMSYLSQDRTRTVARLEDDKRIRCTIGKCREDLTDLDDVKITAHYKTQHNIKVTGIFHKEPKDNAKNL